MDPRRSAGDSGNTLVREPLAPEELVRPGNWSTDRATLQARPRNPRSRERERSDEANPIPCEPQCPRGVSRGGGGQAEDQLVARPSVGMRGGPVLLADRGQDFQLHGKPSGHTAPHQRMRRAFAIVRTLPAPPPWGRRAASRLRRPDSGRAGSGRGGPGSGASGRPRARRGGAVRLRPPPRCRPGRRYR